MEKTERLFRKAGKALESVADGIGRLSKRLGIVGLGLSVYDAYNDLKNNGVNWKPITKAVIGVGLGVLGVLAAIPAIIALAWKKSMANLKIGLGFIKKGRMHIGMPHRVKDRKGLKAILDKAKEIQERG